MNLYFCHITINVYQQSCVEYFRSEIFTNLQKQRHIYSYNRILIHTYKRADSINSLLSDHL